MSSSDNKYLYTDDEVGPVQEVLLDDTSLLDSLLSPTNPNPRFCVFYAPWCPHCIHFKSTYIKIAKEITGKVTNKIQFYAISCTVHGDFCSKQDVHGYPTIMYYQPNNVTPTKVIHKDQSAQKFISNYLKNDAKLVDTSSYSKGEQKNIAIEKKVSSPLKNQKKKEVLFTKEEIYQDVSTSFHYALQNSIYMTLEALSESKAKTFASWLKLLQKTLPTDYELQRIHGTTIDLLTEFSSVITSEEELVKVVSNSSTNKQKQEWTTACTHGDKDMGYTCGLWELFHVMSIGVVVHNNNRNEKKHYVSPGDVADLLRDYIQHFFACNECRTNFIQMYDACAFDRCNRLEYPDDSNDTENDDTENVNHDWKQLPLWLWETHNDVNMRLYKENIDKDATLRDQQLHAQWPSRDDCINCYNTDGSWNEDNVYTYLYNHYWPQETQEIEVKKRDAVLKTKTTAMEQNHVWYMIAILIIGLKVYMNCRTIVLKKQTGKHKKADDTNEKCTMV